MVAGCVTVGAEGVLSMASVGGGGGGVDGAIHRKGGAAILEACRTVRKEKYPDGLPTGRAVVTGSGKLPCRYIIHTVGPVWKGGNAGEPQQLRSAYLESMKSAAEIKAESLAFPALSTGVYGYPKDLAAKVAYEVLSDFLTHHEIPKTVILVFFNQSDAVIFENSIKRDR